MDDRNGLRLLTIHIRGVNSLDIDPAGPTVLAGCKVLYDDRNVIRHV